jgi:hypothetical protein
MSASIQKYKRRKVLPCSLTHGTNGCYAEAEHGRAWHGRFLETLRFVFMFRVVSYTILGTFLA